MDKKLNIVLLMVDQLRYDFLGINGNQHIDTPNLDMMASQGYNFKNAYAAVPSCIAARASIMTGMKPKNHGRVGYEDGVDWDYEHMLAQVFADEGYHTQAVGKMHVYPDRNLCGFHNVVLHDGYLHESRKNKKTNIGQFEQTDDYLVWLKDKLGSSFDLPDLGLDCNSWNAKTWSLPDYTHPTNWATSEAIDFLRRRDPKKPFFLKLSYVRPHSPLDPLESYYRRYEDREVKGSVIGNWVKDEEAYNYDINAKQGKIPEKYITRARKAYSALITHIDDQIRRFIIALDEYGELDNTVILFTSDHGDMLGDHNFFRKSVPYEGSTHIPLIIYDPGKNLKDGVEGDYYQVVELMDIMPTLLDISGIDIPKSVDGLSLKGLIENKSDKKYWRNYIHGEHSYGIYSNHYITDGSKKYIWYSQTGEEQFFDLEKDRDELNNLIASSQYQDYIKDFRTHLIYELKDRPEAYTDGKELLIGKTPVETLGC